MPTKTKRPGFFYGASWYFHHVTNVTFFLLLHDLSVRSYSVRSVENWTVEVGHKMKISVYDAISLIGTVYDMPELHEMTAKLSYTIVEKQLQLKWHEFIECIVFSISSTEQMSSFSFRYRYSKWEKKVVFIPFA